jgi:hypothetical protein
VARQGEVWLGEARPGEARQGRVGGAEGKARSIMADRIACVVDSFDELGLQPANYVIELAGGGFQARVWDLTSDCELILGTYETLDAATCEVWTYADQIRWLMEWFPGPKEYLWPN